MQTARQIAGGRIGQGLSPATLTARVVKTRVFIVCRSEEHTSELQSLAYLVCRLLLEKKKQHKPAAVSNPSHNNVTVLAVPIHLGTSVVHALALSTWSSSPFLDSMLNLISLHDYTSTS